MRSLAGRTGARAVYQQAGARASKVSRPAGPALAGKPADRFFRLNMLDSAWKLLIDSIPRAPASGAAERFFAGRPMEARADMPGGGKLASITAFFPAYNDGGTIPSMVLGARIALRRLTDDYEVVVVNDGSSDHTASVLEELAGCCPELRVIHHPRNLGYGAALRTGFSAAAKEWIFYTDGDAQYDPGELPALVAALRDGVDVVNGYKITRHDPMVRRILGRTYHYLVKYTFGFKLRDVDCDFRLIRRSSLRRIELESDSGAICLEMVKKLQDAGCVFAEVPVHHYHRQYGTSQFFNWRRLLRTLRQVAALWWKLVVRKEHLRPRVQEVARE
jgi:glycosyltransferase involved in cell wall biosynthesis